MMTVPDSIAVLVGLEFIKHLASETRGQHSK
jgi:hypothetical protein